MTVDLNLSADGAALTAALNNTALPRSSTKYAHEFIDLLSHCYAASKSEAEQELNRLKQHFAGILRPDYFDLWEYAEDEDEDEGDRIRIAIKKEADLIEQSLDRLDRIIAAGEFHAALAEIDALILVRDPDLIKQAYKLSKGLP